MGPGAEQEFRDHRGGATSVSRRSVQHSEPHEFPGAQLRLRKLGCERTVHPGKFRTDYEYVRSAADPVRTEAEFLTAPPANCSKLPRNIRTISRRMSSRVTGRPSSISSE